MQQSDWQVRRILCDYKYSVAIVADLYDTDQDEGSEQEIDDIYDTDQDEVAIAENDSLEIGLELYDIYARAVSTALINAPDLINVGYNGLEQVLLVPSRDVNPDELVSWIERERFFTEGLDDIVIPALSEALATM